MMAEVPAASNASRVAVATTEDVLELGLTHAFSIGLKSG